MAHPEVCVCFILRDGPRGREVLLGLKLRGLGAGKMVAPGGKLEPGETPEAAVIREVAEESGLVVAAGDLRACGVNRYAFPHRPEWSQVSWVFSTDVFSGEATHSDELELRWVPVAEIPFDLMWDDARLWLPGVLAGGSVDEDFEFGADAATVVGRGGRPLEGPTHSR